MSQKLTNFNNHVIDLQMTPTSVLLYSLFTHIYSVPVHKVFLARHNKTNVMLGVEI